MQLQLVEVVGASGFEPPTSWSRTKNPRNISNLAPLPIFAKHCAKLLVFKDFQAFSTTALATALNASMRGVGTKMGTVSSSDFQSLSRANIGTPGQLGTYKTYKTRTRPAVETKLSIPESR
jgi:hypothetical protein